MARGGPTADGALRAPFPAGGVSARGEALPGRLTRRAEEVRDVLPGSAGISETMDERRAGGAGGELYAVESCESVGGIARRGSLQRLESGAALTLKRSPQPAEIVTHACSVRGSVRENLTDAVLPVFARDQRGSQGRFWRWEAPLFSRSGPIVSLLLDPQPVGRSGALRLPLPPSGATRLRLPSERL